MFLKFEDKLLGFLLLLLFILIILTMIGCGPQPIPHPVFGTTMMGVPEGTNIGGIKAPEDGFYIGKSRIIVLDEEPEMRM